MMTASLTHSVTALVVTFNRHTLLERCLDALSKQTVPTRRILVIDNASTDGTVEWLKQWVSHHPGASFVAFDQNTGGSGGFSEGLRIAIADGADWVWMMDDDAEPHPDALEKLMLVAQDHGNVYGSLATDGAATSWVMTLLDTHPVIATTAVADIPSRAEVQMLPFLGFMIHRELVERIGLPDAGFFIAADDVEYCVCARQAGAKIFVAGESHIEHPKSHPYKVRFLGHEFTYLALPPWKRYYDTRNRLLIARKHYGLKLLTQTIPGSFVRLFSAIWKEQEKLRQLWAFTAGLVDGLLGRKGRRHTNWGIK
jgi:GT2 family glycosyltransferase